MALPRRSLHVKNNQYDDIEAASKAEGITKSAWMERLLYEKLSKAGVPMEKPKLSKRREESEEEEEPEMPISGSGVNFL